MLSDVLKQTLFLRLGSAGTTSQQLLRWKCRVLSLSADSLMMDSLEVGIQAHTKIQNFAH